MSYFCDILVYRFSSKPFTRSWTMTVILWGLLATLAGGAVMALAAWRAAPRRPSLPPDVELPATRLQRLARWSLLIGVVLAGSAGAIVGTRGWEDTYGSDALRLTFTFLVLATLVLLLVMVVLARSWSDRQDGTLDERDQAILDRAPVAQAPAMLVTLAVWMVGLTESFRDPGAVPTSYLYLVFWSVVVVDVLALPVGILLGYRRR
jgi:hypothetical protein